VHGCTRCIHPPTLVPLPLPLLHPYTLASLHPYTQPTPTLRYRQGRRKDWTKPPTTTALDADNINAFNTSGTSTGALDHLGLSTPEVSSHSQPVALHSQVPVLSAHCPGFVCFAEKSHPQALPFLSTVKSAQQIVGASVKDMRARQNKEVFFVSIQPCFDKKLEASRLVSSYYITIVLL
jgi:hypothetical protein